MTTWVLNTSTDQLTVAVAKDSDRSTKVDSVFIQGKTKVKLPPGFTVEANFLARHPEIKLKAEVVPLVGSTSAKQDSGSSKAFKKPENHPNA